MIRLLLKLIISILCFLLCLEYSRWNCRRWRISRQLCSHWFLFFSYTLAPKRFLFPFQAVSSSKKVEKGSSVSNPTPFPLSFTVLHTRFLSSHWFADADEQRVKLHTRKEQPAQEFHLRIDDLPVCSWSTLDCQLTILLNTHQMHV